MNNQPEFKIPGTASLNSISGWGEGLKTVFSAYKGLYIAGRVAARHKTVCDILIPGAVI